MGSCDKQDDWLKEFLGPLRLDQRDKNAQAKFWGSMTLLYVTSVCTLFSYVHIAIFAIMTVFGLFTVPTFIGLTSLFQSLEGPIARLSNSVSIATSTSGSMQKVDSFLFSGHAKADLKQMQGKAQPSSPGSASA